MPEESTTIWIPEAGETEGDFHLIQKLGAGGMGEVWLAEQKSLERRVAIKFLLGAKSNPELESRLEIEAKSAARLNHPNVIQVIAYIRFHGCPAVVMEYIEGNTLKDAMKSGRRFSVIGNTA